MFTGGEQFAMAKHPFFEGKSSNKMGHGFHSYVSLDALLGRVRLWFISRMRLLNAVDLESWVKLVPPIGQCHWKTSSEKSLAPLVYIHHWGRPTKHLPDHEAIKGSHWWFGTCFFHNIWDNLSHWLSYVLRWLKHVKTTNQVVMVFL